MKYVVSKSFYDDRRHDYVFLLPWTMGAATLTLTECRIVSECIGLRSLSRCRLSVGVCGFPSSSRFLCLFRVACEWPVRKRHRVLNFSHASVQLAFFRVCEGDIL
ncbi:hypothetical protein AVEN_176772-1 [Araneus ventricosus]|uniref:Uncharacterized protein n=1 Tax=Araneus ventricosus TaxID=182803 RepID=A0A4Y2LGD6_ARAVE|nr:hypothetical protein AVEN_176772-1 [Araneus ventricosus]